MPGLGLGVAIKMDDGNTSRACEVVLAALLARLLSPTAADDADQTFLHGLGDVTLRNWNGIEVGRLAAADTLAVH